MRSTENYGLPEVIAEEFRNYRVEQTCVEMPITLSDNEFFYRITEDEIQVSTIANFDRWANSVEFVLPYSQGNDVNIPKLLVAIRNAANEKYSKKENERSDETIDLSSYLNRLLFKKPTPQLDTFPNARLARQF